MRDLQTAIVRLLKNRPFYAQLLLQCQRVESGSGPAVGVTLHSGVPTLSVQPETFAALTAPEQLALLEHVIKHLLHLHPARRKERHGLTWDVACDLAINPTIENLPDGALLPERFRLEAGLAAEEYYRQLSRPFAVGHHDGEGLGDASLESAGDSGPGSGEVPHRQSASSEDLPIDDHRIWQEADSTPQRLAEEVVRQLVRDAWRKSDGEVPADVATLVQSMLAPPALPWRETLRQFVATAGRVGRQSTWKREHRRFAHDTPGQRKRRRLDLLVGVDVSDSTNLRPLREAFARELLHIARGRDSRLTVLYSGSRIQAIRQFSSSQAAVEIYSGGGFTDLRPVFDYARSMQPRPAAVIYLTDGYGEAPERMELPTLWVLTADGRKPAEWGVEMRLGL